MEIAKTIRRFLVSALSGWFLFFPILVGAAPDPALSHSAPKKANFYLKWTLSDAEARELARWDLVILDMEIQSNNPEAIRLMRQLNPRIKILAYITASEIRSDALDLGGISPLRRDLLSAIPEQWFVTDASARRRSFWSGTWIVNVTENCPQVNGERWTDALVRFVKERIYSSGLWDGVMFDNGWENISYFAGGEVDLNRDGRAEETKVADTAWRSGLRSLYKKTREALPNALVMENDGPIYAADVHGLQIENFPNGKWSEAVSRAARASGAAMRPGILVINSNTANNGDRENYKKFRFGLASALLLDAYYGFDYGDQNHGQTWWYDEYDSSLGLAGASPIRLPGGAGWQAGVWRRDYSRGAVLVNSGALTKRVSLGTDLERLHGNQDSKVNDGKISGAVSLDSGDGVILLKPLGEVRGTAVQNGSYVRVFNDWGEIKRNGFFVNAERFGSNAFLLTRVVNGRNQEVIAAENGRVRVFDSAYRLISSFAPFGDDFTGPLGIAVGAGVDAPFVAVSRSGKGNTVKTFSLAGKQLGEFPVFGENYNGGVNVAAGDLDADGRSEIIVGAGAGAGPHVRVFRSDGALVSSGFFAYNPKFRGGVNVAAGDLDADGRSEIVTGAGATGGPHIKVFKGTGQLMRQFFAGDERSRDGVIVGVADPDFDGKKEILAFTKNIGGLVGSVLPRLVYAKK
jgi:hypothetical protein